VEEEKAPESNPEQTNGKYLNAPEGSSTVFTRATTGLCPQLTTKYNYISIIGLTECISGAFSKNLF
jgi:hypothetical protein